MRVTNNLMINKFSKGLNNAATNLSLFNDQVSSGLKFSKASQDPTSALKSFQIRRNLSRNDQYQNNIDDLKSTLDETETALNGLNDIMTQAKENYTQATNGTLSDSDRQTMANVFKSLQDQVLKLSNTNFAGKYIFGGSNTTTIPFTLEDDGTLLYNNEDVNGTSFDTDTVYADMGTGLAYDSSGNLQSGSGVQTSTAGTDVFGYGMDSSGISNNIYNVLGDIATALQNNDNSNKQVYMQKLSDTAENIMVQVAGVGERSNFVDFLSGRMSDDKLNLEKKQQNVEDVDQAQAITDYKSSELTYQAALQMGAKIIQTSLLDYLR